MNKGTTLIELLISMAILGTLIGLSAAIFGATVRTYRVETLKGVMQKDLNYAIDNIANNVKRSGSVLEAYEERPLSATMLILGLPAEDANKKFVYNDGAMVFDTLVYELDDANLTKKLVPAAGSIRTGQNSTVLRHVSNLEFTYSPANIQKTQVSMTLSITRTVNGKPITLSASRVANLRNK